MQQLLRGSGGGGGGATASTSASLASQARPQGLAQQAPPLVAVASVSSITSQPATAPQYSQQQLPTFARRNIFTDIPDVPSLRPASMGGDVLRGGGGPVIGLAADSGTRIAGAAVATAASPRPAAMTPGSSGPSAAPAPYAPRPVPLNNVEDADVALPSFAMFR